MRQAAELTAPVATSADAALAAHARREGSAGWLLAATLSHRASGSTEMLAVDELAREGTGSRHSRRALGQAATVAVRRPLRQLSHEVAGALGCTGHRSGVATAG